MIHKAFEMHFKDPSLSVATALGSILPPPGTIMSDREQKEVDIARGLIEPLQHWKEQFPVTKTLEVEQPIEFYLTSGAKFRGRPDRVVLAYGKVFHMQHKTIGSSIRPDIYVQLMTERMHELLYGWALSGKYAKEGLEYGGTIMNIVRKLKYRSTQKTKAEPAGKILHRPEEMLFQQALSISRNSMVQAFDEINALSVVMDRTMEMYLSGKSIERNRRLDAGRYGNKIDPYTLVAIGEITLDDDTFFMDRPETYDTEETADDP
jgi:hypothetical protein